MGQITPAAELQDKYGFTTLDTISGAGNFNRWMYDAIAPHCKGEILEIGGGIGNISRQFLSSGQKLTVTELQEEYCEIVRLKLSGYPGLKEVVKMDIADPEFDKKFAPFFGRFDTVFALNVVEHIEDRNLALLNCKKLLKPGGNIVILVPAFLSLFNQFDHSLGHYLRFTKTTLLQLLEETGYKVEYQRYFNFMGILGWWFTGSVLKREMIPEGQMALYNRLVPLFRVIDLFTRRFAGLSVISVGINE